jgi:DNA mismatch repair protein MutS
MRLTPVDRIFARVGASDELARGQSTFMVEMVETARILHNATSKSLVILDEIGRGTSTYDGLAIAWAITEHIAKQIGCRTLFATHYHELTELADQLQGVANFNVAVKEQLRPDGAGRDVVFLHKIVPGPTDRSYGVHVAAMAGLPPSVVARSESVLEHLESRSARERRPAAKAESEQLMLFGSSQPAWCEKVLRILKSIDPDHMGPIEPMRALEAMSTLKTLAEIVRDEA